MDSKMVLIALLALISTIAGGILCVLGAIGAMTANKGCVLRYSLDENGNYDIGSTEITHTIYLRGDANYTKMHEKNADGSQITDDSYGQWYNTQLYVKASEKIKVNVSGEVSLCLAYLEKNNLQLERDRTNWNQGVPNIPIPRFETSDTLELIMPATHDSWRNALFLELGDKYMVTIKNDRKEKNMVSQKDTLEGDSTLKGKILTADCQEGKTEYSPICGRISIFDAKYHKSTIGCELKDNCTDFCLGNGGLCKGGKSDKEWGNKKEHPSCSVCGNWCQMKCYFLGGEVFCDGFWGSVATTWGYECKNFACRMPVVQVAPLSYSFKGEYTFKYSSDSYSLSDLEPQLHYDCNSYNDANWNRYKAKQFFWYSADNAAPLLYRYSDNANPLSDKKVGNNYSVSTISKEYRNISSTHKPILQVPEYSGNPQYLQFLLYDYMVHRDGVQKSQGNEWFGSPYPKNTGGFVIGLKQTKCVRKNGSSRDDKDVKGRGTIQYYILPHGKDPNKPEDIKGTTPEIITSDANGDSVITVPSKLSDAQGEQGAYIWMRIENGKEVHGNKFYKDSAGQYDVKFRKTIKDGNFFHKVLDPLIKKFKDKMRDSASKVFKQMTCYGKADTSNCTNFFMYVRSLLVLYMITYAIMFLLGMVQISQMDIIIRLIKISFVAGLVNERTFSFFNDYLVDFILGFSDQIIANLSNYNLPFDDSNQQVSNPLMFMNEVMTKVFFSNIFMVQMLALLSSGTGGIFYFVIICTSIALMLIACFRVMAVYIISFVVLIVLIGLAPIFITFVLFDKSRYLFDNWIKFTIRYMIEPVILMTGVIILVNLFTIYLDSTIGYSVCWKCAVGLKIPFTGLIGFDLAFLNVPIFCFNWFSFWGFDAGSGDSPVSMYSMVTIMMIGYCLHGYTTFASQMTSKLISGGAPSATKVASKMTDDAENSALNRIGLDKKSRRQIEGKMRTRLNDMMSSNRGGKNTYDKSDKDSQDTKSNKVDKDNKNNSGNNNRENNRQNDLNTKIKDVNNVNHTNAGNANESKNTRDNKNAEDDRANKNKSTYKMDDVEDMHLNRLFGNSDDDWDNSYRSHSHDSNKDKNENNERSNDAISSEETKSNISDKDEK